MSTRMIQILSLCTPFVFASRCHKTTCDCSDPSCSDPSCLDVLQCSCDDPNCTDPSCDIDPSVNLQITSWEPENQEPGVKFQGVVLGAGFAENAKVHIGDDTTVVGVLVGEGNRLNVMVPPLDAGVYDVWVENADGVNSTPLREALTIELASVIQETQCQPVTIYFATNDEKLQTEGKALLDAQKDCWNSTTRIIVEGHCDERGTTTYNIALSERRANTVATYLRTYGVQSSNVDIQPKGEEFPIASGHTEDAYQKNRRVEIKFK